MFSYWARGYAFHGGVVALTTRDRNFAKKVLTGRDSICLVPRMNEAINRFISTAVPFWGQTTVISCVFPQNGTTTVLLPHEFRVVYPQTELTAVLKGLIPPPPNNTEASKERHTYYEAACIHDRCCSSTQALNRWHA